MKFPTSIPRLLPFAIMTVVSIRYIRSNPVVPLSDSAGRFDIALNYLANYSIACAATLALFAVWELVLRRLWPGVDDE